MVSASIRAYCSFFELIARAGFVLGPTFEAAKLDGRLAKEGVEQSGYPSPPPSDIELSSTAVDSGATHDESVDHSLPRELAIDPDRLVGPPQLRSILRHSPLSSYNRPSSSRPPLPSSARIPTPTSGSPRQRRLSSSPIPTRSLIRLSEARSSLLNVSYPLRQVELASTVQTIPQETGFFTILGGFLIDMFFELSFLIWWILKTAIPGIVTLLVHTVLVIVSGILTLLEPLTVRGIFFRCRLSCSFSPYERVTGLLFLYFGSLPLFFTQGYKGPLIQTKRRRAKTYPVSKPRMD